MKKLTLVFTNFWNHCQSWNQQSITRNMCWGLPSSGEIWKRLDWKKQIWKRRLTKFLQKSPNFFRNSRNFFHMFLRPQCTFGINSYKSFITGTPSKMVLFQKTWWKRVKEYSFNLWNWKRYCRVLRCGNFETLTDFIALILFEKYNFSWTHFVKSKFE